MCGRLSQVHLERMRQLTELAGQLLLPPRYNIPPSTQVAAIRHRADGGNEWVMLRWGLIPSWAKDKKFSYHTFNAMAETVAQKPAYRSAFRRQRCVVPANGFYEWQTENGKKQPFYIHAPRDDEPLLLAGLWEHWEHEGEIIDSCCVITTNANNAMRALHDRMPALLEPADVEPWLDPRNQDPVQLQLFLRPSTQPLELTRVSPQMNSPKFDGPACIESVA